MNGGGIEMEEFYVCWVCDNRSESNEENCSECGEKEWRTIAKLDSVFFDPNLYKDICFE